MNINKRVAEHFNKLVSYYAVTDEPGKAAAFAKAAHAILTLNTPISEHDFITNPIPFIGPSSRKEIEQFIETNTSERLQQFEHTHKSSTLDLQDLQRIPNTGILQAIELWKTYRCANVQDLKRMIDNNKVEDTDLVQRVSTLFNPPPSTHINRLNLTQTINKFIESLTNITYNNQISIAGSCRRLCPTVNNINIVLSSNHPIQAIHNHLNTLNYSFTTKFHQIELILPYEQQFLSCQLIITSPQEYICSLVHYTGSESFIKALHHHANLLGYDLNPYRLKLMNSDIILYPTTEHQLFNMLDVLWMSPEDRIDATSVISLGDTK